MLAPPSAVHGLSAYCPEGIPGNAAFALVDRMLEIEGFWLVHATACKRLHEI